MNGSRFIFVLFMALTNSAVASAESWGLLLYKEGAGQGRVCVVYDERNECQVDDVGTETNIELNEYINLRATPEPGSHFVQWVGDCRGRTQTCRMLTQKPHNNKPLTATALFAPGPAKPVKPSPPAKVTKVIKVTKKTKVLTTKKVKKSKKNLKNRPKTP